MAKLTLTDVGSLGNPISAQATLNANNTAIEGAFENTLSRDGTSPNNMLAPIDMDGQRILNVGTPVAGGDAVNVDSVRAIVQDTSTTSGIVVSVTAYGAAGDGVTDDTAAIEAAAAASPLIYFPAGTYIVDDLNLPSVTMFGAGKTATTIKRKANSVSNSFISFSNVNGIRIRDLTVDGNKAANSYAAHNISLFGCSDIEIDQVRTINAKAVGGGYGAGISIVDGTNDTLAKHTLITGCEAYGNDTNGVYVNKDWYITIRDCLFYNNGSDGVQVINLVYPPVANVQNHVLITGNRAISNAGAGIAFTGFYTGGTANAPIIGNGTPASRYVSITDNFCRLNGSYGIAFQGAGGSVKGNHCERNGTTSAHGGLLVNAEYTNILGNTINDNAAYGIDMGGCNSVVCSGNTIQNSGLTSSLPGTDLNCGGSKNCIVSDNAIFSKGGAGTKAIYASGYESNGGGLYFDQIGENLVLSNNVVTMNATGGLGVYVNHGFDKLVVVGNAVTGAANINESFVLEMGTGFNRYRNNENIDFSFAPNVASAATTVIPDTGHAFRITGTTGISNIRTYSDNAYQGKVRHVYISNGGSGYNPASPPTVSFTGGGGSGAAGTALVSNSGVIVGVAMTNFGSGYTSAPTVGFSSGTAAGTALIGCENFTGRVITLLFDSTVTVTDGGNLVLNGNLSAGANTTLTLRGQFGSWYEVSRSVN